MTEIQLIRKNDLYGRARWHVRGDDGKPICGTTITGRTMTRAAEGKLPSTGICGTCRKKATGGTSAPKLSVADMKALNARAMDAAEAAFRSAATTPMAVIQPNDPVASLMGDDSAGGEVIDVVMDGPCGFAWVSVRPGTSRFARWLVKEGIGRSDSYLGGVTVWAPAGGFSQSYQRKLAAAEAYAAVLRESGITAHASGRLD